MSGEICPDSLGLLAAVTERKKVFRKTLLFLGMVLIFLFSKVEWGLCAGYESGGLGIRALSMGGAFIGLADDWTAVYWNPAGLAQLKEAGIGINLDFLDITSKDGNSIANPLITDINRDQGDIFYQLSGTEPTQFNTKKVTSLSILPAFGAYTYVKGFTLGVSAYTPLGFSTEWESSVSGIKATYEVEALLIAYNFSLARQIFPSLLLGGGLNILDGRTKRHATKTSSAYNYNLKLQGDDIELQAIFGFLFNPYDKISLGGAYRTGSQADLEGDANTQYPFVVDSKLVTLKENTTVTQKIAVPTQMGFGLAYNPLPTLKFTTDWVRTDWSTFRRQVDFQTEGPLFKDANVSQDWKVSTRLRFGAEYRPIDSLALRAGFGIDPRAVSDKAVSLTNLVDVDRKIVSMGFGYKIGRWRIDTGYVYAFGKETIKDVKYEKNTHAFSFLLSSG